MIFVFGFFFRKFIVSFVFVAVCREMPMEHQRRIIGYQDLDAPNDFDTTIFS